METADEGAVARPRGGHGGGRRCADAGRVAVDRPAAGVRADVRARPGRRRRGPAEPAARPVPLVRGRAHALDGHVQRRLLPRPGLLGPHREGRQRLGLLADRRRARRRRRPRRQVRLPGDGLLPGLLDGVPRGLPGGHAAVRPAPARHRRPGLELARLPRPVAGADGRARPSLRRRPAPGLRRRRRLRQLRRVARRRRGADLRRQRARGREGRDGRVPDQARPHQHDDARRVHPGRAQGQPEPRHAHRQPRLPGHVLDGRRRQAAAEGLAHPAVLLRVVHPGRPGARRPAGPPLPRLDAVVRQHAVGPRVPRRPPAVGVRHGARDRGLPPPPPLAHPPALDRRRWPGRRADLVGQPGERADVRPLGRPPHLRAQRDGDHGVAGRAAARRHRLLAPPDPRRGAGPAEGEVRRVRQRRRPDRLLRADVPRQRRADLVGQPIAWARSPSAEGPGAVATSCARPARSSPPGAAARGRS